MTPRAILWAERLTVLAIDATLYVVAFVIGWCIAAVGAPLPPW